MLLRQVPIGPQSVREDVGLYEIVVTATRRKSSWKDAPAMVTVIEQEEIERARALDGLLKRIPGVAHSRNHAAECGPGRDVTLRGLHDQKHSDTRRREYRVTTALRAR